MIYITTRLNILFTLRLPDNTEQSLKSLKYALVFKKGLKAQRRGKSVSRADAGYIWQPKKISKDS